jgi:hypothetical protein
MYEATKHNQPWLRPLEQAGDDIAGAGLDSERALIPAEVQGTSLDSCCFFNAGTCPDCGSGTVRLGSCLSCPACGYESCGG